ncbi:MaoC family dehydratase N-terminal domain-containing protein [Nocardia sp. NPDC004151]|uniref:FAS1-like dehydratase domain-containing protein n=1 Tax=Nocardia sp. NPDC004151 TaxID=3364304 RepID=UPI003680A886
MNTDARSAAAEQARALVGHHYRCAGSFPVERGRIREFARAVQAYHPAHWQESAAARWGFDALVAPPTFGALVWQQARREVLERLITGSRADRVVHVDQTLEIGRPLLAGDVLNCDFSIESFRHFRSFDVVTVTGALTDQHGKPVQTCSTALLVGGRETGGAPARARPAARVGLTEYADPVVRAAVRRSGKPRADGSHIDFDGLAVNTALPTAGATVTARDLANYALAVGDTEVDRRRFTASGRPVQVAPGQLVLALATGYVSSWTRDPAAVVKFWAEFANHVHYLAVPRFEGADIEFNGRVIACDRRRRTATIAIDARSQGRKLFGYATAEVSFAATRGR